MQITTTTFIQGLNLEHESEMAFSQDCESTWGSADKDVCGKENVMSAKVNWTSMERTISICL